MWCQNCGKERAHYHTMGSSKAKCCQKCRLRQKTIATYCTHCGINNLQASSICDVHHGNMLSTPVLPIAHHPTALTMTKKRVGTPQILAVRSRAQVRAHPLGLAPHYLRVLCVVYTTAHNAASASCGSTAKANTMNTTKKMTKAAKSTECAFQVVTAISMLRKRVMTSVLF
ncbi:hypothetical protein M3J09_001448 [Ascochyta lentis]